MKITGIPVTKNLIPPGKYIKLIILLTGISLFIFSCENKDNADNTGNDAKTQQTGTANTDNKVSSLSNDEKIKKGKSVYLSTCIACHNPNPEKDGSLGPALKGSSFELIKARVLRAEYPPGYTPKRQTKIMQKLPLTEEQISNVAAFLK